MHGKGTKLEIFMLYIRVLEYKSDLARCGGNLDKPVTLNFTLFLGILFSYMLFNETPRFLGEIEIGITTSGH